MHPMYAWISMGILGAAPILAVVIIEIDEAIRRHDEKELGR